MFTFAGLKVLKSEWPFTPGAWLKEQWVSYLTNFAYIIILTHWYRYGLSYQYDYALCIAKEAYLPSWLVVSTVLVRLLIGLVYFSEKISHQGPKSLMHNQAFQQAMRNKILAKA